MNAPKDPRLLSKQAKKGPPPLAGARAFILRLVFGQLRLKRRGGTLHVTWGETLIAPQQRAHTRPQRSASSSKASPEDFTDTLVLMRSELSIALNARPSNREVLRYLVFFEAALSRKGFRALDVIPVKALRKAHGQLQLLADTVASRELTTLAGKMAQAIVRRTGDVDALLDADISRPGSLEVAEGRMSDFFMLAGEILPDAGSARTATG